MPDHDTLCGWGLKEKVTYFLEKADIIIPRRREQLGFLIDLLPWPREEPIRVLDLGCGFGAITEEILSKYPHASVTSVDGSEEMMKLARERLAKYGDRVRLHFADLADPSWHRGVSGPFHAAVSAVAIHHLVDDRKRELYREIYDLVDHGGIFLNDEAVASPPGFKARFEEMHYRAIQEQERAKYGVARPVEELRAEMEAQVRLAGHHSHVASLPSQLAWVSEAGFQSVDCFWKYLGMAIFGGVKI